MPPRDEERRVRLNDALSKLTGGKEQPPRGDLDERRMARLRVRPTNSGPGRETEVVPTAVVGRLRDAAGLPPAIAGFRRPAWVADLVHAKKPPADVLGAVAARVAAERNEAELRQAQMIVNDIGRLPGGGELIRRQLTQELVDKLIGSEA